MMLLICIYNGVISKNICFATDQQFFIEVVAYVFITGRCQDALNERQYNKL